MKYRELGRTGLRVSEIGFGCWAIGGTSYGPTRDEESLEALQTAWEHGVNFYDTADTYGHGHSEELIAQFLRDKPRDQVVIASKAGWDFYHPGGSRKNFELQYIRFACEESLKRLKVGPCSAALGIAAGLPAAGKLRHGGARGRRKSHRLKYQD